MPETLKCCLVNEFMIYRFGQLFDIIDGDRGKNYPKDDDFSDDGYCLFLNAGNVTKAGWSFEKNSFVTREKDQQLRKGHVSRGDTVLTTRGTVGNAAYYDDSIPYDHMRINSGMVILRAKDNALIDNRFIYYLVTSPVVNKTIELFCSGSAQPQLPIKDFVKIKINLPSIEKQKLIISILSAYDNLIEVNNKRIKILEQMAENLYKEWFVRFRFPGYETAEFENGIPKGWEKCRLEDIISFTRGVGYSSSEIIDGDVVLLSMNNIRPYGGYIADYSRVYSGKYKNDQVVRENDLIMSITDMTQDRRIIGYVGIVSPTVNKCVICTHLMKVSSHVYHNYFLYGMFAYSGLSRYISEYATGANVLGLTANILNRIKCRVPSKELADEYTQQVTPLIQEMHSLETLNTNLIKQRDLLLPRLMSGKIEVM